MENPFISEQEIRTRRRSSFILPVNAHLHSASLYQENDHVALADVTWTSDNDTRAEKRSRILQERRILEYIW